MSALKDGLWRKVGLSEEEYTQIKDLLQREPNETEIAIFGVLWSEDYSGKSSQNILKMLPHSGRQVFGDSDGNGLVVDIGDEQAVALKIGAETGVGGIVRTVYAQRAKPIALLNSLHFGSLKSKKTRTLFEQVVSGVADYGNNLQIPTVAGQVFFHPAYGENYLANLMCVGLMKQPELVKTHTMEAGDVVILAGARTGKDEKQKVELAVKETPDTIAAGTVSAAATAEKVRRLTGADPVLGKLLLEACLELAQTGCVLDMRDLGRFGLAGACCKTVAGTGKGIAIDVSAVPLRDTGLQAAEIMLSASPERMLLVVTQAKEQAVRELFLQRGIEVSVIGRVINEPFLLVQEGEDLHAHLPLRVLGESCPCYERPSSEPEGLERAQVYDLAELPEMEDYSKVLLTMLGTPTIAGKEWVYNQYDHLLDLDTMVPPGGDAAVLRIVGFNKGIALTVDSNPRYVYLDPYRGGQIAVAEAARNLVCSGAEPLAVTACFNFGDPENPEVFWRFKEAALGISDACREFDTPVVSEDVNFHHEAGGEAVYPTPVIGMMGLVKDLGHVTTIGFKQADDLIILLGTNKDELGAGIYLSVIHGLEAGRPPEPNLDLEKQIQKAVLELIRAGWAVSAHDCAEGGLAVALAECCLTGKIGAEIALMEDLRPSSILFGETQARIVISIHKEKLDAVLQKLNNWQVPFKVLGNVGGETLSITGPGWKVNLGLSEIEEKYRGAIECMIKSI